MILKSFELIIPSIKLFYKYIEIPSKITRMPREEYPEKDPQSPALIPLKVRVISFYFGQDY